MMLDFIKLAVFSYLTLMGLFITFALVWMNCGLQLTKDALTVLVVLSAVVGIPYILWMLR